MNSGIKGAFSDMVTAEMPSDIEQKHSGSSWELEFITGKLGQENICRPLSY